MTSIYKLGREAHEGENWVGVVAPNFRAQTSCSGGQRTAPGRAVHFFSAFFDVCGWQGACSATLDLLGEERGINLGARIVTVGPDDRGDAHDQPPGRVIEVNENKLPDASGCRTPQYNAASR